MYVFLFFVELFILFLLSKQVTMLLSSFLYRSTHSKKVTIYLMALIFFPGTFIHEISHYLMAHLLFVPTYRIEFFPKLEGQSLKLGSVSIARTDIFRSILIGMAPFLLGTSLLLALLFYAETNHLFENVTFAMLLIYAAFEIGNTMFSSKKDLEGAIELVLALIVLAIILYLLGFNMPQVSLNSIFENQTLKNILQKGNILLLVPITIDIILIGLLKLLAKQTKKQLQAE